MKKTILSLFVLLVGGLSVNAQLKVDSLGKVTMGTNTTGQFIFNPNSSGMSISRYSTATSGSSIYIGPKSNMQCSSMSGISAYTSPSTSSCYAVGGMYFHYAPHPQYGGAGVFGSSMALDQMIHYDIYAGYFRGDVRVTGTLYGTLLTPSSSSGGNDSQAVATQDEEKGTTSDESVSEKLGQVQLLQFYRSPDRSKLTANEIQAQKKFLEENGMKDVPVIDKIPQTELSTVSYGLAADQLREVYPELVYEDKNGNVSINYIEMIPLLVQAVNELKGENKALTTRIAELEGIDAKAKSRGGVAAIDTADEQVLTLAQNDPNPFSEQTSIAVTIPDAIRTATLFIYDMSGKQLRRIDIEGRGAQRIPVTSDGLTEGMYLYSLVADGKIVGTKKMILSK